MKDLKAYDKAIAVAVRFMFSNIDKNELLVYRALSECDDYEADVDSVLIKAGLTDVCLWGRFENQYSIVDSAYNMLSDLADDIYSTMTQ